MASAKLTSILCIFCVLFAVGTSFQCDSDYCDSDATPFNGRCSIRINDGLAALQPLFLVPNQNTLFYPQSSNGIMNFNGTNPQMELFCTDILASPLNVRQTRASCVSGTTFSANGISLDASELSCLTLPSHVARRKSGSCFNGATIIEVGFVVASNRFVHMMDICHDETLIHTYYVKYIQRPRNDGFQRGFPRPRFMQGIFHPGINIDNLYVRNVQRRTIAAILGSDQLAENLISTDPASNLFLARGHIAAMSDYIFGTEQDGTFYLMNAAPQFHTFNEGNWNTVEMGLRRFVRDRGIDIEIHTGTHGIATFADVNNVQRELFLFRQGNRNGIPVPKIYYKIAHHAASRSGIVLIGVNNPYATLQQIQREYIFCTDISDRITWLNWSRRNIELGYSYACDVNEFLRVIGHIPTLPIDNLLL